MRNLVKEYIESGKSFDDLKNEYGININEFDNLICLNSSLQQPHEVRTHSIPILQMGSPRLR